MQLIFLELRRILKLTIFTSRLTYKTLTRLYLEKYKLYEKKFGMKIIENLILYQNDTIHFCRAMYRLRNIQWKVFILASQLKFPLRSLPWAIFKNKIAGIDFWIVNLQFFIQIVD